MGEKGPVVMAEHVMDLWEGGVLAQLSWLLAPSQRKARKKKKHLEGARPSDVAWKEVGLLPAGSVLPPAAPPPLDVCRFGVGELIL